MQLHVGKYVNDINTNPKTIWLYLFSVSVYQREYKKDGNEKNGSHSVFRFWTVESYHDLFFDLYFVRINLLERINAFCSMTVRRYHINDYYNESQRAGSAIPCTLTVIILLLLQLYTHRSRLARHFLYFPERKRETDVNGCHRPCCRCCLRHESNVTWLWRLRTGNNGRCIVPVHFLN